MSPSSTGRLDAGQQGVDSSPKRVLHRISIRAEWCKGCAICVEFCKPGVLVMEGFLPIVVDAEGCTGCLQCELLCPDFAIEVE